MRLPATTRAVAVGLGTALSIACGGRATLNFTPTAPVSQAAKPPDCSIEVIRDAAPGRSYVALGIIDYHHERHRAVAGGLNLDDALPSIRARACEAGADAVIVHVTESRRLEWALLHVRATAVTFGNKEPGR